MGPDVLLKLFIDRRPCTFVAKEREVRNRTGDPDVHLLTPSGVDDGDRTGSEGSLCSGTFPLLSSQERRHGLQRLLRGREADAYELLVGDLLKAFEREREVDSALVAADGVDLIHDDVLNGPEDPAGPGRRQHEIERFGGGDQDIGRMRDHGRPLALRSVSRPDGRTDG